MSPFREENKQTRRHRIKSWAGKERQISQLLLRAAKALNSASNKFYILPARAQKTCKSFPLLGFHANYIVNVTKILFQ